MRELTFRGFLKEYVKELSFCNSTNLTKLANELSTNPRLREPVILYSIFTDKQEILAQELNNDKEFEDLINNYQKDDLIEVLNETNSHLSIGYMKVWKSYLTKKNNHQNDNHTKELILRRVLEYKSAKKISNYRIYTDLNLNHGNINAWLKNGKCEKVSLETARKVLKYTEDLKI